MIHNVVPENGSCDNDAPFLPIIHKRHTPHTHCNSPAILDPLAPYVYDYFLCHTPADQYDIVLPLFLILSSFGVEVFYDPWPVGVKRAPENDEDIVMGLHTSRVGAVILTDTFFRDEYAQLQAWQLLERDTACLPVFYGVHPHAAADARFGELGVSLSGVASLPLGCGEIVNVGDKESSCYGRDVVYVVCVSLPHRGAAAAMRRNR
jgi:hypothetical protein